MDKDPTRERLLAAAMQIFAAKGYERASTRDICAQAGIGNASIHYHFGDKAAIYRALFEQVLEEFEQRLRDSGMERLRGREALAAFYRTLLGPWAEEPSLAQRFYIYLREEFQPTGLVDDLVPRALRAQFDALGGVLLRELKLKKPDVALLRLMTVLQGVALGQIMPHRSLAVVAPELTKGAHWLERTSAQLADAGWELIKAEQRRRAAARGSE
jgi:AcrR family transcriptional regulator